MNGAGEKVVRISMIVAMNQQRVIGVENRLPWHLPEDLKHFKALTMGKPIVMGRKTWESIGRPLPGRANIVVSGREGFVAEGADVVHSPEAAIDLAKSLAIKNDLDEIFVIGGSAIYKRLLSVTEKIYLTEVECLVEGDAWFPELDLDKWHEAERRCYQAIHQGRPAFSFVTLHRKQG